MYFCGFVCCIFVDLCVVLFWICVLYFCGFERCTFLDLNVVFLWI